MGFSTAQAHIVLASVSMVICSVTTLRLAHVHDTTVASCLTLYAWENWGTHLSLSGISLANGSAADLADTMIFEGMRGCH